MKTKKIAALLIGLFSFSIISAQEMPDRKETLKTIVKVNDYFMKKYSDYRTPSYVNKVIRPSNIWTRGVYYEGLMALYSIYPRDDYYKYANDWSEYHEWGFRNGTITRNADDYCASPSHATLTIIAQVKHTLIYIISAPTLKRYAKQRLTLTCWSTPLK